MANVPANITLQVYQGQTFDDEIVFIGPDNLPINLTGKEARMQVRRAVPDEDVLLELSTDAGTILLFGSDGKLKFNVLAATTAAMPTDNVQQTWVYDLEVGDSGFVEVQRMLQGAFVVFPEVTRG